MLVSGGHKPRKTGGLQVIVIPIAWSKREREAAEVAVAVTDVVAALRAAGVRTDSDTTTKLTPGQKYRHW